jgi:NitT/TauT family transport system ATP-binding protein
MSPKRSSNSPPRLTGVSVSLVNLKRIYSGRAILDGLNLEIAPGEFVALLGPSGCGKSTLMRLVAALDQPDNGHVRIGEDPWPIAYVFQDASLMPWRSVLENVSLPLELIGKSRRERRAKAMGLLETVGLAEAMDRYPGELSGGMRMRVSLARALITDPRLLLLDEPFAALDALTRQYLDGHLQELFLRHRMTVLLVTHSLPEAVFLADRVVVMSTVGGQILMDRRIDLPRPRPDAVRNSVAFAAETTVLSRVLTNDNGPQ